MQADLKFGIFKNLDSELFGNAPSDEDLAGQLGVVGVCYVILTDVTV